MNIDVLPSKGRYAQKQEVEIMTEIEDLETKIYELENELLGLQTELEGLQEDGPEGDTETTVTREEFNEVIEHFNNPRLVICG